MSWDIRAEPYFKGSGAYPKTSSAHGSHIPAIPAMDEPDKALSGLLRSPDGLPEAPGWRLGGPQKRTFCVGGVTKIEIWRLGEE